MNVQRVKALPVIRQVFDPAKSDTHSPPQTPPLRTASGPDRNVQRWGALPVIRQVSDQAKSAPLSLGLPPLSQPPASKYNVQRVKALPVICESL